ncbi:hypothetical protein OAU56_02360 [Nitrosopumilus sp.]|nr:hypothetical protein [Nitrosopumilus sp.]
MEFIKAKYFVPVFMLVLLTSGVPLNTSNDGDILPIVDAAIQTKDNGNKIFFCENNPIKKTEFDKPHMKPQDYMAKCKERTEGFSWGSRIYVLLWAPGFNADDKKLDELGADPTGANGLIKINTREGSSSLDSNTKCNQFIETGRDHGLFYGSIKLSGYKKDVTGDGKPDNYGGNRCEGTIAPSVTWKNGAIQKVSSGSMGVLDDGALRAEARQQGAITMSFQYNDKGDTMFKSATHTWRLAELYFDEEEYVIGDTAKLTMSDLDGLRYPFDKKLQYPLRVYSDTDKGGIIVDVTWKPNYRLTPQMHGDYPTNIKFVESTWRESGSNYILYGGGHSELRVSPGDNVYAEYDDYTLPLPYQENDYKQVTTIAKIVEVKSDPLGREIVEVKNDSHAKQFAFTKYTSNGEYLVSIWWNQWDWWTNQPSLQADNALNISIVEGLTEKSVSDISYKLNVSSDGNSLIDQEIIHVGTDKLDISLDDSNLIEIVLSDIGKVDETLNFKFKIDS